MPEGQLVYMDESGDAGFKVKAGSTPTLVVTAVIFQTPAAAQFTAECIHAYRRAELQKGRGFQFHFTNCCRDWRLGFFRAVRECPFAVRAIVMQKDRIWEGTQLRRSGGYFYNFTVRQLLTHTFGKVEDAKLFVDGEAGRESLKRMVAYLRQHCRKHDLHVLRDIKFVRKSEGNVLVQLADMASGAIARSYQRSKDDRFVYRRTLAPRLEDVWEFGRPGE